MKICALIPVYNNAATIGDVIARCRAVMEPDVLVVADGCTDGSADIARDSGVRVVEHLENAGKGQAIRTGMMEADRLGYTHVVVVDADGQHLPEEIPRLLDAVWETPGSIWVGVREMADAGAPRSSLRGRAISNFWATLNGWRRCHDAQSGFRVYPVQETLKLGCSEPGFQFEMEVLVRAAWRGLPVGHVPVAVAYDLIERVSHFDMRRDNWKFSWLSFKMFWGMVLRSPLLAYRRLRGR